MAAMTKPTLLILAAGMGSRFGGVKMIEPVGPSGESILDYSLFDARRAGFGRVVLVIRREIEPSIRQRIGMQNERRLGLEYLSQEVVRIPFGYRVPTGRIKPWGTTHAILTAAGVIREPFAVINVNDFYGADSFRALANYLQSGSPDHATLGWVLRNTLSDAGTVARGVCQIGSDGYLERIIELRSIEREGGHARNTDAAGAETRLSGDEIVSMNMWGFTPEIFPLLEEEFERFLDANRGSLEEECFISRTVNELLMANRVHVKVLRCADSWFGVTYRDDHTRAVECIRRLIESGVYPKKLW
jgi:NDP-sugar pyrophosphorylase family protein